MLSPQSISKVCTSERVQRLARRWDRRPGQSISRLLEAGALKTMTKGGVEIELRLEPGMKQTRSGRTDSAIMQI
jgi:hypothetical protein